MCHGSFISIHLMFLLISGSGERAANHHYFNTSHVSINLSGRTVYGNPAFISIHLMFLLIAWANNTRKMLCYFNTSHVSINLQSEQNYLQLHLHFNTSHVSINPTLLSAFPFLLYLKFLENTSFFKFFPSVSQT